jgi:NAD(P)H-nitrite reductase large subunit
MRCVQVTNYHTKPPTDNDEEGWDVYVQFNDGQIIGCDFVIEALGVTPNTKNWKEWCPNASDNLCINF